MQAKELKETWQALKGQVDDLVLQRNQWDSRLEAFEKGLSEDLQLKENQVGQSPA